MTKRDDVCGCYGPGKPNEALLKLAEMVTKAELKFNETKKREEARCNASNEPASISSPV